MSAASNYQVFRPAHDATNGLVPTFNYSESLVANFSASDRFDRSIYDTFEFLTPSYAVLEPTSVESNFAPQFATARYLEISLPYRLVPSASHHTTSASIHGSSFIVEQQSRRSNVNRKRRYPNPLAVADHRVVNFCEKFLIPFYSEQAVERFEQGVNRASINALIRYLHFAAGVSYAKTSLPNDLVHQTILSQREAEFFSTLYKTGLGELAHNNHIDISNKLVFKPRVDVNFVPRAPLPYRPWCSNPLLPFGGGKDSFVSFELLKAMGTTPLVSWVGSHEHIRQASSALRGSPVLEIQRQIDPQLFQLNEAGAYNGHVPITGILAFALLVTAAINGSNSVIMSNERSASEPSMVIQQWNPDQTAPVAVNHQYSKSFEFEKAIQELLETHVVGAPRYYSLLRPLSELQICRIFASHKQYHRIFSSCNKSFTIDKKPQEANWCNGCAKCAFVYLALAPFTKRSDLLDIFGENLFAQTQLSSTFYELCGFDGHKPFECVGEIEEARLAVLMLLQNPEWMDEPMLRRLGDRFSTSEQYRMQLEKRYLSVAEEHAMPTSMYEGLFRVV